MKKRITLFITTFLISLPLFNIAQQQSLLSQLQNGEKEAIEAIALYPEKQRSAILEASKYPAVLVRMQNIRKNSEADFQALLSDLTEEEQKQAFDISRYPELIASICENGKKRSDSEMDDLLKNYPDDTKETAKHLNKMHFSMLQKINELHSDSQEEFDNVISEYSKETKDAYYELLKLPEVLTILNEYMNTTVLLGDIYKSNPEQLKQELDSLNTVVAEQKAKELEEWKQSLENDPEAMAEYEEASKEFADDQGYDASVYTKTYTTNVYVYDNWRPYSYWFGPPWWYYYDYWYPYPWWYHCGYYYGPNNVIVLVGFPSPYFVHWHYYHHQHFYYYPHFTNHMITYYNGHRESMNSVNSETANWVSEHRNDFPEAWIKNDGMRVERIKEFGKFEIDYERERDMNTSIPSKRDFLENNASKYPAISNVLKDEKNPVYGKPDKEENLYYYKPHEFKPEKPVIKSPDKVTHPASEPQKVYNATDYHHQTWRQTNNPPKVNPRPVKPHISNPPPPSKQQPMKINPQIKPTAPKRSGGK